MNNLLTHSWQQVKHGSGFRELTKERRLEDLEDSLSQSQEFCNQNLMKFNETVSNIEREIGYASSLLEDLNAVYDESKGTVDAAAVHGFRQDMQADLKKMHVSAVAIKKKIDNIMKANDENVQHAGCERGSATDRHRRNITRGLGYKLKEFTDRFNALRTRMDSEYRETIERRVYTVTGVKADPNEIEKLIETGKSEQIFQRAVKLQGRNAAQDVLAEMQERHDAVQNVKKQLLELNQIFQDMAMLVDSQGELINDIQTQVEAAADYTKDARSKLEKAVVIRKNTRKWQRYGVMICVAILVVLLIISLPWLISFFKSV